MFSATKGFAWRGLCSCSARATSSLPVPDSPVMSTATLERDRRPMARNTCCIAGALPNNSGISGVCVGALVATARGLAGAPHQLHGLVDVERLGQVLECAALVRGHGARQVRVRGHDDDRQRRMRGAHFAQQVDARAARHADVGEQHVRRIVAQRAQARARQRRRRAAPCRWRATRARAPSGSRHRLPPARRAGLADSREEVAWGA